MLQRFEISDYINDYLCQVPHNRKFGFGQTAEVLYNSASCNKDFSGYRAALGWDAIGRYAANLITKPWRREYRKIKVIKMHTDLHLIKIDFYE